MNTRLPSKANLAGVQIPVVTIMLLLVLLAILIFDRLAEETRTEIQVCAFTGIVLLVIDAIGAGTTSVRDRNTLLTLSWGITAFAVLVVVLSLTYGLQLPY